MKKKTKKLLFGGALAAVAGYFVYKKIEEGKETEGKEKVPTLQEHAKTYVKPGSEAK
jgi:hypothetical protein